ncbi:hypothetical protein ACE193_02520 [Bernardetia sp. OM2101]|uniref:hypothetical protein n=1 Tax=Bernardetia sp. OM2101 TaxID=3344876 RepID=UPI0035CFB028
MKNLILVLCVFSIFSCANTKKSNSKENSQASSKQDTTMNYKELAKQKLNVTDKAEEKFECITNTDKTFVLCKKTIDGTVMQPRNSIQYVVYDTKTNEMVYEGSIGGGFVKWYDKNRLEIYQQLGIPMQGKTQDDLIKIYDLVEKTYRSKSNVEKSEN